MQRSNRHGWSEPHPGGGGSWRWWCAIIARKQGVDPSDIEIWLGDEARIGQKNKITRRWARRGSRPSAPLDQRTASTYILHLRRHLTQRGQACRPDASLLLDQPGRHLTGKLAVPANITIVPLPPKCPELNPQEDVWRFIFDNWLQPRVR